MFVDVGCQWGVRVAGASTTVRVPFLSLAILRREREENTK
jgi:hypothetical protein